MHENTPMNPASVLTTQDGGTLLSARTSRGYDIVAKFKPGKEALLERVIVIPRQSFSAEMIPKKIEIELTEDFNPDNGGKRRLNGIQLSPDESFAISEAVAIFGGVAHKYGLSLKDLYGKVSGEKYIFVDYDATLIHDEFTSGFHSRSTAQSKTMNSTPWSSTTEPQEIPTSTTSTTIPPSTTTTTSNVPWTTTTTSPEPSAIEPESPAKLILPPFH